LWQILRNDTIGDRGSILFWDEPEANLNPKLLRLVAEILLELSRQGVQIFLATHEYALMKYFSILKKPEDSVAFFSLFKTENDGVLCEREDDYDLLDHNPIIEAVITLHENEVAGVLKNGVET
jgi:predicted ATPase